MKILVVGGNTQNKGAYLMLVAVLQQARQYIKDVELVVSPYAGDKKTLSKLGYKILDYPLVHVGGGRKFSMALKWPTIVRAKEILKRRSISGEVAISEIALVLDISGFAYSDQFGSSPIANLKLQVEFFHKKGIPYVMMPQALGPFDDNNSELMRQATELAAFIFARDKSSYSKILATNTTATVHQYPDITLSLSATVAPSTTGPSVQNYVCIVPNSQMLRKAGENWKANYVEVLQKIGHLILKESNYKIMVLIHSVSGGGDEQISRELTNQLGQTSRVVLYTHEDPLVLKSVLKGADLVVASRFHALASSLSSDTPSVAISWAHKYEELFKEYGVAEHCHREISDELYKSVLTLLDTNSQQQMTDKLRDKNKSVADINAEMWSRIKGLI